MARTKSTSKTWEKAAEAGAASLRRAYLHEIARFAKKHRSEFESGELGGHKDGDSGRFHIVGEGVVVGRLPALFRLQALLWEEWMYCSPRLAGIVLAVSPSTETAFETYYEVEGAASVAAAYDVLRVALERGWYRPVEGEEPSAEHLDLAA